MTRLRILLALLVITTVLSFASGVKAYTCVDYDATTGRCANLGTCGACTNQLCGLHSSPPSPANCPTGATLTVGISNTKCNADPDCRSSTCSDSDDLSSTTTVTITGCNANETRYVIVCENWTDCGSYNCNRCTQVTMNLNGSGYASTVLSPHVCRPDVAGTYQHKVGAKDVTSGPTNCLTCDYACENACNVNCNPGPATAASCCITI